MACMTRRAAADGTVRVGASDAVALFAAAGHGRATFKLDKGMRRPARAPRLIRLGKVHLLRSQSLFAVDGSPRRRCMAASQKLLVNVFVTTAAVSGSQFRGDDESMMLLLLLPGRRLVTIEAIHAFLSVHAHLVFMHHRILESRMALSALSAGAH